MGLSPNQITFRKGRSPLTTIEHLMTALNYIIDAQESLKKINQYDTHTASCLGAVAITVGNLIGKELTDTDNSNGLTENEKELARQDRRIETIKSVRARTGLGLREAREMV